MKEYDIAGIGSALLDITYNIEEPLLMEIGLKKSEMCLIDKEKSLFIFNKLKNYPSLLSPGGSVANSLSSASFLGGKTLFFGKIGDDSNGKIYEKDTLESGVYGIFSKDDSQITGHAITFITPDGERTFATHLGASLFLNKNDLNSELIKKSRILHIEGYQLEVPEIKSAIIDSIEKTRENNVLISIDLSDSSLIKRNLQLFREFIRTYADIVFANEKEAEEFTGKNPTYAIQNIAEMCDIAVIKLGERGSLIKSENQVYQIPVYKNGFINTNGAGDNYAGAFLYGIANDFSIEKSGMLASYAASLAVASPSARLKKDSREKIEKFYFCRIL